MRAFSFFLVLTVLAGLSACSTDVDVNAPYVERPTIYAALDAGAARNYIRIERSFLTIEEKNADSIAKYKDSTYYPQDVLRVTLTPYNKNTGVLGTPIVLRDTVTYTKESGLFYGPDQLLYVTPPGAKLDQKLYQAKVVNQRTGVTATAITSMISPLTAAQLVEPSQLDPNTRLLIFSSVPALVAFRRGADSLQRFQITVTVPVQENLTDGSSRVKTVFWNFAPDQDAPSDAQISVRYSENGQLYEFYRLLSNNVDSLDATVLTRKVLPMTLTIITANKQLGDYIDAIRNYSVLTQTHPYYSNVQGGIGIVGSRNLASFTVQIDNGFYGRPWARGLKFVQ